jgi:hypothetical protein
MQLLLLSPLRLLLLLLLPAVPGYYPKGGQAKSNQQAQIDMIDESLSWAGVDSIRKVRVTAAMGRGDVAGLLIS